MSKPERPGGGVEVGAVDEQGQPLVTVKHAPKPPVESDREIGPEERKFRRPRRYICCRTRQRKAKSQRAVTLNVHRASDRARARTCPRRPAPPRATLEAALAALAARGPRGRRAAAAGTARRPARRAPARTSSTARPRSRPRSRRAAVLAALHAVEARARPRRAAALGAAGLRPRPARERRRGAARRRDGARLDGGAPATQRRPRRRS